MDQIALEGSSDLLYRWLHVFKKIFFFFVHENKNCEVMNKIS